MGLDVMNQDYELGYKLYHDRNYEEAYKYFLKAADNNYPLAFLSLAKLYHRGRGINLSYEKALYYYKEASKYELGEAYYFIGELLYKGLGINKDINEALNNYEKAISYNYDKALVKYVEICIENNILNNKDKLIKYLNSAISKGSTKAKAIKKLIY